MQDMQETYKTIENEVLVTIEKHLDLVIEPEDRAEHLFSKKIDMDEVSLLYLVCILEEKYGIRFDEGDFASGDFFYIEGLAHRLYDKVLGKQP